MRKTVRKWFWIWDFDKEESWLNEMAAKGLCLVSVGFCRFEFEECLPGEYGIRLELLEHMPNHPESVQYLSFLEETGAEHIGTYKKWVYLRKKKADGEFELFSDNTSRIKHLTRILQFIGILGGLNLLIGSYNLFLHFTWHTVVNLLGCINIAIALFAAFGFIRLYQRRKRLKREQQIFEN